MTFVEWLKNLLSGARPWVVVRPWEQGVRVYLGKHAVMLSPGFYWKIPIIHTASVYAIRLRTSYAPLQTLRTKDGRTVSIGIVLKYRIADLRRVLDTLHNPEGTMIHMALGGITELVESSNAHDVRAVNIKEAAKRAVGKAEQYGIADFDIIVTDNADLTGRTLRMLQESRWTAENTEIDRIGNHS